MKILLFILFLFITLNGFSQEKNQTDKPYIDVSGQADTLVMPNKIWITVLLAERDFKGKKSVEDAENEMIKKLQEIGIDTEKNLSMNDMTSNYKTYLLKQTDIFKTKSYSIIVTDAKMTSKVFLGLESIGISNVQIEKIENSDAKKIQLLINGKATENARQIAESYSNPLHQKIGNALQISSMPNYSNQLAGRVSGVTIRGISSLNKNENYEPNIKFEKIKISSSIQVRFLLE
ncbi:SIMPL domain-containing protein [Flavobacterium sp. MC2016-06]|jgi:uncharacterized protein YggE|uniref:SIMPL domain-containing protein n=1 Tax=Flavobacterium sp. MC2016-06 TaxID=2676308 RepID=UPI0012BAF53D|nr:SIMPL domain-containing protein [Flavobacterium sp. MC2016-06]MBU3860197.1 SIMPL domain-containing protein [Flavobacterium sp. MC2016-06]